MSRNVVDKASQSKRDITECYFYIAERNPDAARRFRQAVDMTFALLAEMPDIGSPYKVKNHGMKGLRRSLVKEFENYQIFYLPAAGGIKIIRVLHCPRDIRTIMGHDK